ncbi:MAG: isochorismate synthase [Chloroflexota bacterium]|nr:isochorismate synthase [Chloroflexota bacterium]
MSTILLETVGGSALQERLCAGLDKARTLGRPVLVSVSARVAPVAPLGLYAAARARRENCVYLEWPDRKRAVVGVGAELSLHVPGAQEAGRAAQQWRSLLSDAESDAGNWGTGPVLMGGFAFDPGRPASELWRGFPAGLLAMPRHTLASSDGESWLTTNLVVHPGDSIRDFGEDPQAQLDDLLGRARRCVDTDGDSARLEVRECASPEEWKRSVRRVVRAIQAGGVAKVALARAVRAVDDCQHRRIETSDVLARLRAEYPACTIFAVARGDSCFLGASPESLVSLQDGEVRASCLAGSRPRGITDAEDARLGSELLASAKDRREHEIVARTLVETLRDACGEVWTPPEAPRLLRLHNVQHLYTPITATAREEQTVLDLVGRLHPTPAVGGFPREEAVRLIREHEGLDRGWYAGPVGWVDARGEGEFVVGIRSALVQGNMATLYAGCGIVRDSDPESEYRESVLKLQPMLSALGGV